MRLSHTLLALTLSMSPPGLSLAGNCPDKNNQENTIAQQVQAAT